MSKHTITQLKAPWPAGARVGDVIELPAVPSWAVGKCKPAPDDVEPTVSFSEVSGDGSGEALPSIEAINAQVDELQAKLDAALAANEVLTAELRGAIEAQGVSQALHDKLTADNLALQAKLDAALAAKAKK